MIKWKRNKRFVFYFINGLTKLATQVIDIGVSPSFRITKYSSLERLFSLLSTHDINSLLTHKDKSLPSSSLKVCWRIVREGQVRQSEIDANTTLTTQTHLQFSSPSLFLNKLKHTTQHQINIELICFYLFIYWFCASVLSKPPTLLIIIIIIPFLIPQPQSYESPGHPVHTTHRLWEGGMMSSQYKWHQSWSFCTLLSPGGCEEKSAGQERVWYDNKSLLSAKSNF